MLCEVKNIVKSFPTPVNTETISVLNTVSLSIESGQSLAIVGPSGSGKTTLLNIIATLGYPDSGTVKIEGSDITTLSEKQLSELRNKKIGLVFQHHYLLPHCTLLENILIPTLAWPLEITKEALIERAHRLAERVGLKDRLHHRPEALSGGECQRGAVVRALINSPALLCADEPTGSLDRTSAETLGTLLVEINKEEKTALIVVTHSQQLAARMDYCLQLRDGKLQTV